jgi:hypothetical protein
LVKQRKSGGARLFISLFQNCAVACTLTILHLNWLCIQATASNHNWIRERFNAAGQIVADTAMSSLPRGASQDLIHGMMMRLVAERNQVRCIIKEEVEKLLRLGAEITQMTYMDKSTMSQRSCVQPKSMRESYLQDGGLMNIKRVHWIFHELPFGTHQDVLSRRQTHMDLVVSRVEHVMDITWAPKKEGETKNHRNCLEHTYSRILNEKKQTIIKEDGTNHRRKPLVKHPKTFAASNRASNFKRGKTQFYWVSKTEGEHWVSSKKIVCAFEVESPNVYVFCIFLSVGL